MKQRIISIIAILAGLMALPSNAQQPTITYVANAGVSIFTSISAKATSTSGAIRLPLTSGVGALNITGVGITGSPSGCSIALAYQQNNSIVASSAVATVAFTPAVSVQQLAVNPTGVGVGDNYVATYSCSSTYPTAGTISVSFSPAQTGSIANFGDPCLNPNVAKSSVAVSTSGAGTTQLVALAAGKSVYACSIAVGISATTATTSFAYGTGTNCGSGTTAFTGVIVPTAGMWLTLGWGGTNFTAPAGNAFCIVNGGTGTQIGVLTYVQQ